MKEKRMIEIIISKLDLASCEKLLRGNNIEICVGAEWYPYARSGMMKRQDGGLIDVPFNRIKAIRLAQVEKKPLFK